MIILQVLTNFGASIDFQDDSTSFYEILRIAGCYKIIQVIINSATFPIVSSIDLALICGLINTNGKMKEDHKHKCIDLLLHSGFELTSTVFPHEVNILGGQYLVQCLQSHQNCKKLQSLARARIRATIGRIPNRHCFNSLEIPPSLKKYLLFDC